MSSASLRGALSVALASLVLCAPAAVAMPGDLSAEGPTSWLTGTTDRTSAEATPGRVLRRSFDPYPGPASRREAAALEKERSYSTYGEQAPHRVTATTAATDSGDGIAWIPFVLGLFAALLVGLGAGSGLQARRHATPAT